MQLLNPLALPVHQDWPTSLAVHSDHSWPVAGLAADMAVRSWVGPPIALWDDPAFSGTHRLEAWKAADGVGVPCVDEVYGDEVTTIDVVIEAVSHLPSDITHTYGLDLGL